MERLAQFVRSQEAGLWETYPRTDVEPSQSRLNSQASPGKRPSRDRLTRGQTVVSRYHPLRSGRLGSNESGQSPGEYLHRSRVSPPQSVSGPLVGTAALEAEALPLHRQIVEFSRRAQAAGAQQVKIIPLFLLAGVHVMEDIPAEVEQARLELPGMTLTVTPHLGAHPGIGGLLSTRLSAATSEAVILLAHGSRRPRGTDAISALARALGGEAAFWAVPPSLESQVIHHMQTGVQRLAILPYFLFAGKITDAITHLTEELAERFPSLSFHLLPPLGPSPELARLAVDLALDQVPPRGQQSPAPMKRVAFRHSLRSSSMVS